MTVDGTKGISSKTSYLDFLDLSKPLEDNVMINIFSTLPRKNLLTCSLVSKKWQRIASDKLLWEKEAKLLELVDISDYRRDVLLKIKELKEFVRISNPQNHSGKLSVKKKRQAKCKEEDQEKKVELVFYAHLKLCRLGLSSIEIVKDYAKRVEVSKGTKQVWLLVATELARLHRLRECEALLENPLKNHWNKNQTVLKIILLLCQDRQLDEAYRVFLKHAKKDCGFDYHKGIHYILSCARESKRYDLVEAMIENALEENNRATPLLNQCIDLVHERKTDKVKELMSKYHKSLTRETGLPNLKLMLKLYVLLGEFENARDFAKKSREGNLAQIILRNTFQEANLIKEAEELTSIIEID